MNSADALLKTLIANGLEVVFANPEINWVSLSKSMGVPANRTTNVEQFSKAFSDGLNSEGPSLIEVII